MRPRVYLAGPDVFHPDASSRAATMKLICDRHGLTGVSPLDTLPGEPPDAGGAMDAFLIARRNEAHIRQSSAILANLTPFRGPNADPGTVYEVGFGRALGRPVFGYATIAANHADRVRSLPGSTREHDAAGLAIEDFGLFENLMISCGIEESGGFLLAEHAAGSWDDLAVFERCAARAAAALHTLTRWPPPRPVDPAPIFAPKQA